MIWDVERFVLGGIVLIVPNRDFRMGLLQATGQVRPLRIGIFTNVLENPPSGIGWHVIRLLQELGRLDQFNEYFLLFRTGWRDRSYKQYFLPSYPNFTKVPIPTPNLFYTRYFRVFDQFLLPRIIRKLRLDVFHGPNHYLPKRSGVPQLVTFHDIAEAVLDQGEVGQAKIRSVVTTVGRSDGIISLSECTKRDLERLGGLPLIRYVISQGGNCETKGEKILINNSPVCQKFGLSRRFLLFVGSIVPRKNVPLLIKSFARLLANSRESFQLVLAGDDSTPEAAKCKALAAELGVTNRVIFTGYLENAELEELYQSASVFAFPSSYEGFGIILLEAMAASLPIVCTDAGALPEILGDAGITVASGDEAAFAAAIQKVLESAELAAELVRRGHERRQCFSWTKMAEQTLAVYREIAALKTSDQTRPEA